MPPLSISRQTGFSLVELLIAMVIGLLVILAATSGASVFEASRRNTMGNNGALENAIATSFNIQREVQSAGLWTVNAPCKKIWQYNYTTSDWESSGDTSSSSFIGAPVIIGGAAADTGPDNITINSMTNLIGAPVTLTAAANGAVLTVSAMTGFAVGDTILIAPPSGNSSECYLGEVTSLQPQASKIQTRPSVNGVQVNALPSAYNYPTNSMVFNLGKTRSIRYRVTQALGGTELNTFEEVDMKADTDGDPNRDGSTTVLADNIVLMRMQYGVSAGPTSLSIDHWVNAGSTDAAANRLRAVRLVVVARSQQPNMAPKDKDSSGVCTTTTANPAVPWSTGNTDNTTRPLDLDLTDNPLRKCYQYRVTNITIPLKNYLFAGGGA